MQTDEDIGSRPIMRDKLGTAETGMPLAHYLTRLIWLSTLPLLLMSGWLAVDSMRFAQADFNQDAGRLARNFATLIDRYLISHFSGLNLLASGAKEDVGDGQDLHHFYRHALAFYKNYGSHVVLAEAGAPGEPMRMLFNTREPLGTPLPPLPRPKGHAAAPAALATGRPAVGDLFPGPVAGVPLIAIAVPLREYQPARALLATVEAAVLQQRLDGFNLPAGWALSLRDGTGAVIAHRGQPGPDAAGDTAADVRHVVELENAPWSAVLEVPHGIYQAPLFSAAVWLGLGVLGAALASILGGGWAARRLARAVAWLAQPAVSPAAGAPLPAIAEIDAVRHRLDRMERERATSEAALRESEEKYRSLFENMLNSVAYCRMLFEDGKPVDWVYLDVNLAFDKQTSLAGVTGLRASEVIPGIHERDPELLLIYGRVVLSGRPERFEIHLRSLGQWFSVTLVQNSL